MKAIQKPDFLDGEDPMILINLRKMSLLLVLLATSKEPLSLSQIAMRVGMAKETIRYRVGYLCHTKLFSVIDKGRQSSFRRFYYRNQRGRRFLDYAKNVYLEKFGHNYPEQKSFVAETTNNDEKQIV